MYTDKEITIDNLAKAADEITKAVYTHETAKSHATASELLAKAGLSNFVLFQDPKLVNRSGVAIHFEGGTFEISILPQDLLEPFLLERAIPIDQLNNVSAQSSVWTDNACFATVNTTAGSDSCDHKGGRSDDPANSTASDGAFDLGSVLLDRDALIELITKLPSLTPRPDGGDPEIIFDWWEELKKRFGAGAIFDMDVGKTTKYTFLARGEMDVLISVELGDDVPPKFMRNPVAETEFRPIMTEDDKIFLLPRLK